MEVKNMDIWSLRMRASKVKRGRDIHISGAEGLYKEDMLPLMIERYYKRAIAHPRGNPDSIVITAERLEERPKEVSLLPVKTLRSESPEEALKYAAIILQRIGISETAIRRAIRIVRSGVSMRGASLMAYDSGKRLEPDKKRGIRVSRLGIDTSIERSLSRRLGRYGINTVTVREALILASKVASCDGIIAELCISDDPDYTTGYVASRRYGYVRITNIKEMGSMTGGRVFFLSNGEPADIMDYLEKRPVIATGVSKIMGEVRLDEILGGHNS